MVLDALLAGKSAFDANVAPLSSPLAFVALVSNHGQKIRVDFCLTTGNPIIALRFLEF